MDKKDEIWDRIDKMHKDCEEIHKECGLLRKKMNENWRLFFKLNMNDIHKECWYEDRALILTKQLRDQ